VVGSSGGAVSMMNEHGVSLSRNTGMQTKQVQVIKCKACGEILSLEHNYHYTAEDRANMKAARAAEAERTNNKVGYVIFFILTGISSIWFLAAISKTDQFGRPDRNIYSIVSSVLTFGVSFFMFWFFSKKLKR